MRRPFLGLLLGLPIAAEPSASSPPLELLLDAPTSPYLPCRFSSLLGGAGALRLSISSVGRHHPVADFLSCRLCAASSA